MLRHDPEAVLPNTQPLEQIIPIKTRQTRPFSILMLPMRPLCIAIVALTIFTSSMPCHAASPKWEYRVVDIDKSEVREKKGLEAFLNRLGEEGWELADLDLTLNIATFKRSK